MSTTRYTFSNGAESRDWKDRNCDRCTKGYDEDVGDWRCDLERAVDDSAWRKGTVMDDAAAARIGYVEKPYGHLAPDCAERVVKQAEPGERE